MTLLIMLHSTRTGTFGGGGGSCIGLLDFGPKKTYPPAPLCVYVSDMQDESE